LFALHSREAARSGDLKSPVFLSRRFQIAAPCFLALLASRSHAFFVSKVEQIKSELRKLSQAELHQIRDWLDDLIEDELELTPEFEEAIRRSKQELAEGKFSRIRVFDLGWYQ
jgi:cell shape-determining protein MreC